MTTKNVIKSIAKGIVFLIIMLALLYPCNIFAEYVAEHGASIESYKDLGWLIAIVFSDAFGTLIIYYFLEWVFEK